MAPTGCSLSCGLRQRKVSGQRVRRLQKVAGGGTPTLQPLWAEGSSEPRPFFAFPGIRPLASASLSSSWPVSGKMQLEPPPQLQAFTCLIW